MKLAVTCAIFAAAAAASAQIPDVLIHLDVRLNYRSLNDGGTAVRWYDTLGRPSLVGLSFTLEPGFKALVTQKLERIPHDGDPDQLDEYYVEDEGNWRVGKQELPFGPKFLDRESVLGARTDTSFIIEHLPLDLAVCDGGLGRQRGVVGRFGTRLGVSFEVGDHFAISSQALSILRHPEDSPGIGRGYHTVVGVDYSKGSGDIQSAIEFVALRGGETSQDADESVLDVSATLKPDEYRSMTFGFTRAFQQSTNIMRVSGSFYGYRGATFEPMVRYKDGKLLDFGISLHFKV